MGVFNFFNQLTRFLGLTPSTLHTKGRVRFSTEEIECEFGSSVEKVYWRDVDRVFAATFSPSPLLPPLMIVLCGAHSQCSAYSTADGFEDFVDAMRKKFPGLEFNAGRDEPTEAMTKVCWERHPMHADDANRVDHA